MNFNGNCAPKGNKFSKSAGKRPPATHKIYLLAVGARLFREASKVAAATDNLICPLRPYSVFARARASLNSGMGSVLRKLSSGFVLTG